MRGLYILAVSRSSSPLSSSVNCDKYGGLYQWGEAMQYLTVWGSTGLCPSGWHIPSEPELSDFEIAANFSSNILIDKGQGIKTGTGTNSSGFSALLAGCRYDNQFSKGYYVTFWSSSQTGKDSPYSYILTLYGDTNKIYIDNFNNKSAFSIRCIKDN